MELDALLLQQTHATRLIQLLITGYFSNLTSILVVFNSSETSALQLEYLDAVEEMMKRQQQPKHHRSVTFTALQWLNVASLDEAEFEEKLLNAVDVVVTEGFITILANTSRFLHARYYATRNAELRLKDKFYLFLCDDENPTDFLQLEILQFYPRHLMVTPSRTSMNVTAAERRARNPPPTRTSTVTTKTIGLDNKFASVVVGTSVSHRDIAFELWTQKFVGGVGSRDAVQLDSFEPSETFESGSSDVDGKLYPDKLLNLQGRTLRLGSITYIPYVVTNYVAQGDGNVDPISSEMANRSVFFDGSEAKLVETFCQVYNCHLLVESYGVDNWGVIHENESSSGMLGGIFNQDVELAIGCIYNWYNNVTETSDVIARSAAPSIIWVQTVDKSDILMEQILTKNFEIRDYDFLKNASFRMDYGLAIERLMSGTFSFGTYVTVPALETKIIMKDNLYFDWTCAVSIRGWPLMPLFNQHVHACMETGLFVHWERQMVWQYIDRQVQQILLGLSTGYSAKSHLQKLTLENVSGAMFALLCGYLLSFVVFVLEFLWHFIKQKFLQSE